MVQIFNHTNIVSFDNLVTLFLYRSKQIFGFL